MQHLCRRTGVAFLLVLAQCAAVTPVQKVIEMLANMKASGDKELASEVAIFDKYRRNVNSRTAELDHEIKTAKALIEELIATITKAESDIATLTTEIAEADKQTNQMEADQKAATALRESEHKEFLDGETNYEESLYAVDRAIQMLKAQNMDRAQATALLQQSSKNMKGMRRVLAALALAEANTEPGFASSAGGAPAVAAYEFQSSAVVDMLTKLEDEFRQELGELQKEEMNSNNAYSMIMVNVGNSISQLKAQRQQNAEAKAQAEATAASSKGELAETKASLAEAEKFLADMEATFSVKKATYEMNQEVRRGELQALAKAIEILSDPTVQEGPSGRGSAASFLQLGSARRLRQGAARDQAATYLQRRAKVLGSKALAGILVQMAANPFDKVISMVEGLIARLKDEAASEADHKAYCDEELKNNKLKRDKYSSKVERLAAEIEEKKVDIQDMGQRLTVLAQEQADLRNAIAEATEQRNAEKVENAATVKDAKAAQVSVKNAVLVLKEFYQAQGDGFLQVKVPVPEMKAYHGMQRKEGGVIGMLEVIQSDFARVESDTVMAETQSVEEYNNFMDDAEAELKSKHDSEFKLGLKKDQAEFEEEQLQKDHDVTQEQLDMANKYYEELTPQCVNVNVSFEERSANRKEEIEALKNAYHILNQKE